MHSGPHGMWYHTLAFCADFRFFGKKYVTFASSRICTWDRVNHLTEFHLDLCEFWGFFNKMCTLRTQARPGRGFEAEKRIVRISKPLDSTRAARQNKALSPPKQSDGLSARSVAREIQIEQIEHTISWRTCRCFAEKITKITIKNLKMCVIFSQSAIKFFSCCWIKLIRRWGK